MYTYNLLFPMSLLSMDIANLDAMSENYTLDYYLDYLLKFPYDFITVQRDMGIRSDWTVESDMIYTNPILGYIFGKLETKTHPCMHVSALTVGPPCRRMGIATTLLHFLEMNGDNRGAFFSDLYVRSSNKTAIALYKKSGYHLYRLVYDYYSYPPEDANDMRKPLKNDVDGKSLLDGKNISAFLL